MNKKLTFPTYGFLLSKRAATAFLDIHSDAISEFTDRLRPLLSEFCGMIVDPVPDALDVQMLLDGTYDCWGETFFHLCEGKDPDWINSTAEKIHSTLCINYFKSKKGSLVLFIDLLPEDVKVCALKRTRFYQSRYAIDFKINSIH